MKGTPDGWKLHPQVGLRERRVIPNQHTGRTNGALRLENGTVVELCAGLGPTTAGHRRRIAAEAAQLARSSRPSTLHSDQRRWGSGSAAAKLCTPAGANFTPIPR